MMQSVAFGVSAGVGVAIGDALGATIPKILPDSQWSSGKTLVQRAAEVSFGAGFGYAINRYAIKNDFDTTQFAKRLVIIAGASVAGEYAGDYATQQALDYLN